MVCLKTFSTVAPIFEPSRSTIQSRSVTLTYYLSWVFALGPKSKILQKLIAARVIGERVRGGKRKFKGLRVANLKFNSLQKIKSDGRDRSGSALRDN